MIDTEEKVTVELSPDDARLFMEYRKHQDTFNALMRYQNTFLTMIEAGALNVKNGQAVLNFDSSGTLAEIDLNIIGYKRGKPMLRAVIIP